MFALRVLVPIAMFLRPVVFASRAELLIATLLVPVVLAVKPSPITTLEVFTPEPRPTTRPCSVVSPGVTVRLGSTVAENSALMLYQEFVAW